MTFPIDELAVQQLKDYRARNPGTFFAETALAIDVTSAYALQEAVTRLRIAEGERIIGYKVGCTGPRTTAQFGMKGPIRGTLFRSEVLDDGNVLDYRYFNNLAIEGEMAMMIGEEGEIDTVFPVIELHNLVFRAPNKTLSELIGNNGLNAGIVVPGPAWPRSKTYIDQQATLSVHINGAVIDSGNLWPLPNGALGSLLWLKQHLLDFTLPLLPGYIILAGTTLGLYRVCPGDSVAVHVDGQLAVQCSVDKRE